MCGVILLGEEGDGDIDDDDDDKEIDAVGEKEEVVKG
jgi:hypothetical protein